MGDTWAVAFIHHPLRELRLSPHAPQTPTYRAVRELTTYATYPPILEYHPPPCVQSYAPSRSSHLKPGMTTEAAVATPDDSPSASEDDETATNGGGADMNGTGHGEGDAGGKRKKPRKRKTNAQKKAAAAAKVEAEAAAAAPPAPVLKISRNKVSECARASARPTEAWGDERAS